MMIANRYMQFFEAVLRRRSRFELAEHLQLSFKPHRTHRDAHKGPFTCILDS